MFNKKYEEKRREYMSTIFSYANKLGFKTLDLIPKDGKLFLVNLDKGKKQYLLEIIEPGKWDCLNNKKFSYHIEKAREKLLEVYNEISSR